MLQRQPGLSVRHDSTPPAGPGALVLWRLAQCLLYPGYALKTHAYIPLLMTCFPVCLLACVYVCLCVCVCVCGMGVWVGVPVCMRMLMVSVYTGLCVVRVGLCVCACVMWAWVYACMHERGQDNLCTWISALDGQMSLRKISLPSGLVPAQSDTHSLVTNSSHPNSMAATTAASHQ